MSSEKAWGLHRWCAACRKPLRQKRRLWCFCSFRCVSDWADDDPRAVELAMQDPGGEGAAREAKEAAEDANFALPAPPPQEGT